MPVGIDRQLKPIPDAELRVDRRQVMAHGGFADAQTIGNRLVLEPWPIIPMSSRSRAVSALILISSGSGVGETRAGHFGQHTGQ